VSCIDRIDHGDVPELAGLMTDDHRLVVLDEPPVVGTAANTAAWKGDAAAFPDYVIYPHETVERRVWLRSAVNQPPPRCDVRSTPVPSRLRACETDPVSEAG
jgi:hypothetical protein